MGNKFTHISTETRECSREEGISNGQLRQGAVPWRFHAVRAPSDAVTRTDDGCSATTIVESRSTCVFCSTSQWRGNEHGRTLNVVRV